MLRPSSSLLARSQSCKKGDFFVLYCGKREPRPFRRSYEGLGNMYNSLIQHNFSGSLLRLGFVVGVFALVLGLIGWEVCEAQQIPRRIDVSTYQNRGPTPPLLAPRGPLLIQPGVSPYTGERFKTYFRPSARQLEVAPSPFLQDPVSWTARGRQMEKAPDPFLKEEQVWSPGGKQSGATPGPFPSGGGGVWIPKGRQ